MSIEAFTKLIPEYEGYPDEAIIRIECSVRELRQTANKISAQPEEFLQPTREEVEAEVVTDEEIRPRQEALLRRMEEMRKAESAQPERVSVPVSDERISAIEDGIAANKLTAAQVFTQMRALLAAAQEGK